MLNVVLSLVPLMVGSALLPTWITLIVLLLRSPRGQGKALALVGSVTGVRLLQGLGADRLLQRAEGFAQGVDASPWVPALLAGAGAILLAVGLHGLLSRGEPSAAPPRWFGVLQRAGVPKCALAGVVLILTSPRQWILTMSAAAIIREAGLGFAERGTAFLIFTAGAESLILAPVAWALIDGERRLRALDRLAPHLRRSGRRIAGVFSTIVGVYFLWHGIASFVSRV